MVVVTVYNELSNLEVFEFIVVALYDEHVNSTTGFDSTNAVVMTANSDLVDT